MNRPAALPDPTPAGRTAATPPARRAATALWVAAAAVLLTTGCLGLGMVGLAATPRATLDAQPAVRQLSPAQREAFAAVHDRAGAMAAAAFGLGVVPALGLTGLGFGVRRRRRWPTAAARVLAGVLAVAAGLWLTVTVAGVATGGLAALPAAAVQGGVLWLLIRAWRRCSDALCDHAAAATPAGFRTGSQSHDTPRDDPYEDPWDARL